ncbi:hypothetical protein M716_11290 [Neisseria gonorrhoeae SK32402]|nr:hypothetical protein M716_11290 [Neisseria gonorrhoeae SK32402]
MVFSGFRFFGRNILILWRGTRGFGIDRIKIETAASAQTSTQQKHRQHHSSLIHQWIVHNKPDSIKE